MSLGSKKLKEYMAKAKNRRLSQNDIAAKLECSRSYLSELINDKKTPSIIFAGRVEGLTKIKIGDWNKPEGAA